MIAHTRVLVVSARPLGRALCPLSACLCILLHWLTVGMKRRLLRRVALAGEVEARPEVVFRPTLALLAPH
jgi:hypothetical protein